MRCRNRGDESGTLPSFVRPGLEPWALAFSAGLATLCGVVLGLAPAAHARPDALGDALKTSARGGTGARSQHTRAALVIAEVSLAVVLLVSAGLMIRSMGKLLAVDPGFARDRSSPQRNFRDFGAGLDDTAGQSTAPASPPLLAVRPRRSSNGFGHPVSSRRARRDGPLADRAPPSLLREGDASTALRGYPGYVHGLTEFFETLRIPLRAGRASRLPALEAAAVAV